MLRYPLAVLLLAIACAPAITAPIDVTSFADRVVDPGGENEDWQPAFQAAIQRARQELRPIHVPAGEYKLRQPITIVPVTEPRNSAQRNAIRIFGDGQNLSVISQQVETENVLNWTGLAYEEPCNFGELKDVCLVGGNTALNIKWHNYFTLDSCYIHGPKVGVYTEGWSSRFVNSTIRWCFTAGIDGGSHFNNNVIRDCYFSRDGIGVRLMNGVHGSRIEGCAFERCAKAAVFLRGTRSFTINNSYFEGNAYRNEHRELFDVQGPVNNIQLDYRCGGVTIHDNILRVNMDPEAAAISISYAVGARIYDNFFLNTKRAVVLRSACETNEGAGNFLARVICQDNEFENVDKLYDEDEDGLIAKALTRGCAFETSGPRTCDGDPTGDLTPEFIGEEVLDAAAKRWYKATGPAAADWAPLN